MIGLHPMQARAALGPVITDCDPTGEVYFENSNGLVNVVDMNGTFVRSVQLPQRFHGDIAMTPNGNLYAMGITNRTLYQYDPVTGAVIATWFVPDAQGQITGLSALNDNTLIFGSAEGPVNQLVYSLDLTTLAVTQLPNQLPGGYYTAGDFFDIGGGDLLGLASNGLVGTSPPAALFILHADGTSTMLGTLPTAFGMGRIGNSLYVGLENGTAVKIADYAALQPGSGPIATEPFYTMGTAIFGATSSSEAVICPAVNPATGTGNQGSPVTVRPSYSGGTIAAQAEFTTTGQPAGSTVSADGKTLIVPGEGVWTMQADGSAIFTPDPALVGNPTPVSFSANDTEGNSAPPALLSVTYPDVRDVLGVGDPGTPVTVPPALGEGVDPTSVFFPDAGQPAGATVSADGQTITFTGEGVWTVNGTTGAMTFTPEAGFTGIPTPVFYSAALTSDPTALATPAQVSIAAPGVLDVTGSGDQGEAVPVPWRLANDMDPTTVQLIDPTTNQPTSNPVVVPGEGTWSLDPATNSIVFTPDPALTRNPTPISYTAKDVDGNQAAAPATVTVTYPDVVALTGSGDQGQPVNVPPNLPAGMDPTTVQLIDPVTNQPTSNPVVVPDQGTWTVDPTTGVITFTPVAGFTGNPTPVNYTAQDADGNQATPATVTVTYPDVVDLTGSGDQGQPVNVPPNLPAGMDPTTVQLIDPVTNQPTSNPVIVPNQGTWTVDPTTGVITFTPVAGFTGNPTPVNYTARDGNGNQATPATVTLTYPDVVDLTGFGNQGQPVNVPPNLPAGMDPTTVQLIDPVTNQPTSNPVIVPDQGTWTVDPTTGVITFTPVAGFQGDPTPVAYTAKDGNGSQATPATVTLTYPDVVDLTGNGPQGQPVNVPPNLPAGMDPTTVQLIDPVTNQPTSNPVVVPNQGTWTVSPTTGVITFTPVAGFQGDPTPVNYTAKDGNGSQATPATVTLTYPDVVDLTGNGPQGQPVNVPPNLPAGMDPTTVQLIDPVTNQPTSNPVIVPNQGTWTVDPTTGVITFTPVAGFAGNPTPVTYTARDGNGNQATPATVTVTTPDVVDLTGSGPQGDPVNVPPNLPAGMDPTTVQIIDPVTNQPTRNPVIVPDQGTWTVDPNTGVITFTPVEGFQGDPTPVRYTATDVSGNPADPATVTVSYPDVVDLSGKGSQGDPVTVQPNLPEGMDPTSVKIIDPRTGQPSSTPVVVPGEGTWTVDPNTGVITFTPESGFQGDPTPITYTATDGDGNPADPGRITIDYPDVPDLTGGGPQGDPVTVTPELPTGVDPGTLVLIDPKTGQLTTTPVVVPGEGTWTIDPGRGTITFTPETGFQGDPTPITYTATDGDGNPAEPGRITIDYPDAPDISVESPGGTPVTVTPDLPKGVDPSTLQLIDPKTGQPTSDPVIVPGEGTWTVDPGKGTVTFTPEAGFNGSPTPIQYIGRDANGNPSLPGTITITVTPSPSPTPTTPGQPGQQGNPRGVAIDSGSPEAAQARNVGLIAAGGALMAAALGALGLLARRRRDQ